MLHKISLLLLTLLLLPSFVFARNPNDPYYENQWYLERINAPQAWGTITGSREIVVAVLDAGIDMDHPDLSANLWQNSDEILDGIDNDNNGFIDDYQGWDFVTNDNDPGPVIENGADSDAISHGSIIAGIIGAVGNNNEGITGINWQVSIMAVRTLNRLGIGSSEKAAKAINYAVANGADIINLSFAGVENDLALQAAVEAAYDAGVIVVAAAGNEAADLHFNQTFPVCYGTAQEQWVIGVGATDVNDQRFEMSNYGECVDVGAPGHGFFGTVYYAPTGDPDGDFEEAYEGYWSGTSMSSPVVAGATALMLAVNPNLSSNNIVDILEHTSDPLEYIEPCQKTLGQGRINIQRAIEAAQNYSGFPETPSLIQYGISPVTGGQEMISNVENGDCIRTSSFSTVYHVGQDSIRRIFIDAVTYFTYADTFDTVGSVSDATLPTMSIGGTILPKPGVVLVKIQSDPRVYATEVNENDPYSPILRAIETEEIARQMYGARWADYVIDVEPTFFSRYTQGEPITKAISVNKTILKTRQEIANLINNQ
ncbi:MAG: S8 family peptidase [Patescibacteria group bacterium]